MMGSCHHVPSFGNKDRNLPLTRFSSDSSIEGTEGNASQIKAFLHYLYCEKLFKEHINTTFQKSHNRRSSLKPYKFYLLPSPLEYTH